MPLKVGLLVLEVMLSLRTTVASKCSSIIAKYDDPIAGRGDSYDYFEECAHQNWQSCKWVARKEPQETNPGRCINKEYLRGVDYHYEGGGSIFKCYPAMCGGVDRSDQVLYADDKQPGEQGYTGKFRVDAGDPMVCAEYCGNDPECMAFEWEGQYFTQLSYYVGYCTGYLRSSEGPACSQEAMATISESWPDGDDINWQSCWKNPYPPKHDCKPKKFSTWTQTQCNSKCNIMNKGCHKSCADKCNGGCQCTKALWCRDDPYWHYKSMSCASLARMYPDKQKLKRKCKRFMGHSKGGKKVAFKAACPEACGVCVNTLV